MEEELSISLDGKNLANLRVVDLKQELEKRGLSKSGSKKDLIKRLKQQLEFEKLCEERKSTGDCELKKELDAATQQNEFVQRYLAQQQKIFAEQKEVKRLVELEESQKKSDTEECIISPKIVEKPSSSDEDTEEELDSSTKNNTGENTLKGAIEEISLKKKKVEKETVKDESGETPSSGNVTVERHIIKIERDKVYSIISNKNQDICTDIKSGDDKNSSKEVTKTVSSEEECSVTSIKHENILSLVKHKQANEKDKEKSNKSHLVVEVTENVPLDYKHNQRDASSYEKEKNIKVSSTDKNTSKIENICKVIESNICSKNKSEFLKIDTDKSALKCEDTNKTNLKTESTNKSAIKIKDTGISALKTQNIEKRVSTETHKTIESALLTDQSTHKSALKTEYTDKSESSKIENTEGNSFKIEDTSISALKRDTSKSASLKIVEDECVSPKVDEDECALKNKARNECTLKSEDADECVVKAEEKGECAVKSEEKGECTVRSEEKVECTVKAQEKGECAIKDEGEYAVKAAEKGECAVKAEKKGECAVKAEEKNEIAFSKIDTDESALLKSANLKNKEIDLSIGSENKDVEESTSKNKVSVENIVLKNESALKNAKTDKNILSKNEDSDKSVFLNVENTDLEDVRTEIESNKNQIAPDCQSNMLEVGQSKNDLCSAITEKKIEDVPKAMDLTQGKADKRIAEIERISSKLISDGSCMEKLKVTETSSFNHPCQTSPSCKENVQLLPSSHQKVEPVPDSNIELIHPPSESFETNVADNSSENKLVSMESAVPYSLSDIQLPDSPSSIVKSAVKATSKKETLPPHPANDSDKDSHSDNDMHRNGLNSGSKSRSREKSVLDDTSNKRKMLIMDSKKPGHQNTVSKKSSKESDIVAESAILLKSKQAKNKKIIDSEEKTSRKVEEKSLQRSGKHTESHTSSSSNEESSGSSRSRKRRQPRSKISGKQSKIHRNRSHSSSSSSSRSRSEERTSKKLSKDSKKKSLESDVSQIVKTPQIKGSIQKTSRSKHHSSSSSNSSSRSREASPVNPSKKDIIKSAMPDASRVAKKLTECSNKQKASKSRSHSPPGRENQNSNKPFKEDAKKSIELDVSKVDDKYSKSSSDKKTSKSKSRSPTSRQSSKSRRRSPLKQSKEDAKKLVVPDPPTIVRKRHSSSDQKSSKSRSRSPTMASSQSSKSPERSPVNPSKQDFKKLHGSDASKISSPRFTECSSEKNTSKSRSCSPSSSQERSPIKQPNKDVKISSVPDASKIVRKHQRDSSSEQKTSESRSRSPSSSQSRERSPVKVSKGAGEKRIVDESSRIDRKYASSRKTSKSRSRSPSRSESDERSPLTSKDNVKESVVTEVSRTRKSHSGSISGPKTSKSRSRSPSSSRSSRSRERSPKKSPEENVEKSTISRSGRKREKDSKSRSSTSSSSPPPHQALELFFSQSKKRKDVQISDKNVKDAPKSLKTDVKGTVDQKSDLPCDPPRKKLKINRNNVVISSLGSSEKIPVYEQKISNKTVKISPPDEETMKISPSSPKREDEQRESTGSTQLETVEREMGEIIENSPEVKYEPRKIKFPGRKLRRESSEDQSTSEPKSKKSKWGKFASSQKSSQAINISTDSLKNWFPEFKLVNEPSVVSDSIPEESPPIKEEIKLSFPVKSEEESTKQSSTSASHQINDEPNLEAADSGGPISKIVFVQNLVRPFTLLQLKDLLRQTGTFIEDDFWIDKIKSKCFVTYATEEEAVKTRNALNGVRWPPSNPKILSAEFSTEEEFEHHRSGKDAQKPVIERLPEAQETYDDKTSQPVTDHRRKDHESDKRKDRERYRPQVPVREWDKDKVLQDSPDREKRDKNIEGYRGSDKKDKKDAKKRTNEDTPAKLLDDLFQKTKSVPCIYWLPLTEAQVLEHEESKRLRRLEREKRNQQREKEESEQRNKRSRPDHRTREVESRRSSTRSRSPTSRRR